MKNSIFLSPKNRIFPKGGMFNNVLDTKETFFGHKKFNLSKCQKSHFSTGVNPFFGQRMYFFLELFSVKIRLEIMFNYVIDRKETFSRS